MGYQTIEPLKGTLEPCSSDIPTHYPRSPLRYPGGKSRAVKAIFPLIPPNERSICSPFIGGASIELVCASTGVHVKGYDIFEPLVDFWHHLLDNPEKLAERVKRYYPMDRKTFYFLQKNYLTITEPIERAAVFYALNRSSFSGLTLSGGMSLGHPRFTHSSIEKLRGFVIDNFTVEKADYRQSIADNPTDFLYLDPPYRNGQKLYGIKGDTHESFDHHSLKELLDQRDRWILSYNDCLSIRKLYKDYRILNADWQYGMSNGKDSSEILVVSHDLRVAD